MIQKPRGTRDILPPESRLFMAVEATAHRVFQAFGAEEIRTPTFEHTELFVRSVGETTDIVHKEMYTFADRKGRSLTLRPEGTAGVARAFLENGLHDRPLPQRLYYIGPMFRYERMQRGRYREFRQIGLEIIGAATPLADAECILVLFEFFKALGFSDLVVHLNNLGDPEDRARYSQILRNFFGEKANELCQDCQRRREENPLRILDCKVPHCQELAAQAPGVDTVAGEASQAHVGEVEALLSRLGIPFERNPRLVRGLDYYVRTVFEVVSPELGTSTVICGGGRYDRLLADLGGPELPGVGFAVGEDRLVEILPQGFRDKVGREQRLYLVPLGAQAQGPALELARELTRQGVAVELEVSGRSLKAALKRADKLGRRWVAILGEEELAMGVVALRDLQTGTQRLLPWRKLATALAGEDGV
ncbi:MAG: histidine--tRNA ligase [Thermoanaerobaculum sp.]|nr:MAG: histidine--tRNA ligase [Thermoanaerobaculum sp.]